MQSQLFSCMFKRPQNKVLFLFHSQSDSVFTQFVEYDCDFLQEKREREYINHRWLIINILSMIVTK